MSMEMVRTNSITAIVIVVMIIKSCDSKVRHATKSIRCQVSPPGSNDMLREFNENGFLRLEKPEKFDYDTSKCIKTSIMNLTSSARMKYYCDGDVLLITGNDLEFLPTADLLEERSFDKYIINRNTIANLSSAAFKNISLRSLIIADNKIEVLNDDALECIDGLQSLTIKGNNIFEERVEYNSSWCSSNLTRLHIEANKSSDKFRIYGARSDNNTAFPNLEILSFQGSKFTSLTWTTFLSLRYSPISTLNLRATKIKHVGKDVLTPVQKSLKRLDLANATISLIDLSILMMSLRDPTAEQTSYLETLSLANMRLTRVPRNALRPVQFSLKALSLHGNDFGTEISRNVQYTLEDLENPQEHDNPASIQNASTEDYMMFNINHMRGSHWSTFPPLPMLRELDLRNCKIDNIQQGSFDNVENLKTLHISRNNILILYSNAFSTLSNLLVLDISYNGYISNRTILPRGMSLTTDTFLGLDSLQFLRLSRSRIAAPSVNNLKFLPPSLVRLSLCGTGLTALENWSLGNLSNLRILDLSRNFGLGVDLPSETLAGLYSLQELHMAGTAVSDLTILKDLRLLKVLNLRYNYVIVLQNMFTRMPYLERLDLSNNYVSSWKNERVFASNSKLRTVFFHNNTLTVMTRYMLQDFESIQFVSLGGNQFVCNCNLRTFLLKVTLEDYISNQNATYLIDYRNDSSHVCTDTSLSSPIQFNDVDAMCVSGFLQSSLFHILYISIMVILAVVSLGGLIYWKRIYIRYFALLIKNATMLSIVNTDNIEERTYTYDLFVSYCEENRDWIIRELIPNIEGVEFGLTTCLHERDFEVGVTILENIIWAMSHSRTLLLVISSSFLKSEWCQFEMHLAQQRILESCREDLILVFLEDVPKRSRPKILHYLMLTKTYITWPNKNQDTNSKKLFWKRLRKAISIPRRYGRNSSVQRTSNRARECTDADNSTFRTR